MDNSTLGAAAAETQWALGHNVVMTGLSDVLPLAIAIAASPFPIVPAILLLFTSRPVPTAGSFLAGWAAGIAVVTVAFTAVAEVIDSRDYAPTWVSWTRIVLGGALIALGIKQWLGRGKQKEQPAWMASLTSRTPASAARLGLTLSAANPKVLLLAAAAGLEIGSLALTTSQAATLVLAFTTVGSLSVAAPLVAYGIGGEKVREPLGKAKDWLERNNAAVMSVVITAIGLLLLLNGIDGL